METTRIESGRYPSPRVDGKKGSSAAEAEGSREEFREAMRGGEKDGAAEDEGEKPRERLGGADAPPPLSGDALLRGLGLAGLPPQGSGAAELAGVSGAASGGSESAVLAAELAERILVNADHNAGGGEVRISLKNSVLPDTEIILRREGAALVVQLASGNVSSLHTLQAARADLQDRLQSLGMDASVEVLDGRGGEGGADGRGERSRGLDYIPADNE
ncbi:MAG: hypothetical protein LBD82_08755 [Deltaproteobacteria bacterium]|jgi:type III secretion system needle length determinant|nr:hypothetical protein [Deltaproteobacteria bacterium]